MAREQFDSLSFYNPRFELEAVLGQGGMGVVHAAYELERRVAVKVLHGKNASHPRRSRRHLTS